MKKVFATVLIGLSTLSWSSAQEPSMEWARHIGDSGWETVSAITSDGAGYVYMTGSFEGVTDLDPGLPTADFTATGSRDAFILKLNKQGNYVWATQIGGSGEVQGVCIQSDLQGNVYVAGQFTGVIDLVSGKTSFRLTAVNGTDAFILKLNANYRYVWAKTIGMALPVSHKLPHGMDVKGGYLYVAGEADEDAFVSKLDTAGNFVWTKTWGGHDKDYGHDVAVDPAGNVLTTGMFYSDAVDFDPGLGTTIIHNPHSGTGAYPFVLKLDANGNFVWVKAPAGSGSGQGYGIVTDEVGNVYTIGNFSNGALDFNYPGGAPYPLSITGATQGYIAKYAPSGALVWAGHIGGRSGSLTPKSLAIDKRSHIYLSGWFDQPSDFNPGSRPEDTFTLSPVFGKDIFICAVTATGNLAWAMSYGSTNDDYGYAISVDSNRTVHQAGVFSGYTNFILRPYGANFPLRGVQDIYALKLNQLCNDTSSSVAAISVCSDSYTFHGKTYDKDGTYRQILTNAAGCDSTVIFHLTLKGKIEHPIITVSNFKLSTQTTYDSYQWMVNGNSIPGATGRNYLVNQNGLYRVIVTNEQGCIDTSDAYEVNNYASGIGNTEEHAASIRIYPNPAGDVVHIETPLPVRVMVTGVEGRAVQQTDVYTTSLSLPVQDLAPGIYFIRLFNEQGRLLCVKKLFRN